MGNRGSETCVVVRKEEKGDRLLLVLKRMEKASAALALTFSSPTDPDHFSQKMPT